MKLTRLGCLVLLLTLGLFATAFAMPWTYAVSGEATNSSGILPISGTMVIDSQAFSHPPHRQPITPTPESSIYVYDILSWDLHYGDRLWSGSSGADDYDVLYVNNRATSAEFYFENVFPSNRLSFGVANFYDEAGEQHRLSHTDSVTGFTYTYVKELLTLAPLINVTGYRDSDRVDVWFTQQPTPVPEPATSVLFGIGLVGLFYYLRRVRVHRFHSAVQ